MVDFINETSDGYLACEECHAVYETIKGHACSRAFVAECHSIICRGDTRDLDHYLNCSICNDKSVLSDVRPKFTVHETVNDFRINELPMRVSKPSPIANLGRAARVWCCAVLNRAFNFNIELGTTGDKFLPKFRLDEKRQFN